MQRPTRPIFILRSWLDGSARENSKPRRCRSGRRSRKDNQPAYAKAAAYAASKFARTRGKNPNVLVLDREFETQSIDPMFLSLRRRARRYNTKTRKKLELVLGCSLLYEARGCRGLSAGRGAHAPFKPARIDANFAHLGGGFGLGRDHTPPPLYAAFWRRCSFLAGPARLAHDRYQQFQAGIKRHPFKIRSRIGIDRTTGKIQAFAADHVLDGGGPRKSFSWRRCSRARPPRSASTDIPKVDVTTVAVHSRGVTSGSMRGYGTLQTMTALEVLIDEAAAALPLDPIEFRRRNALKPNGRTMMGNRYSASGPHAGSSRQA